ncbi:hypothetical protein BBJ28_00017687 [Nothophytophthora sp. Chile5]|nr:hypothetical protein BBJ28_00017687 [Nothophytophthora sp. Chile5]
MAKIRKYGMFNNNKSKDSTGEDQVSESATPWYETYVRAAVFAKEVFLRGLSSTNPRKHILHMKPETLNVVIAEGISEAEIDRLGFESASGFIDSGASINIVSPDFVKNHILLGNVHCHEAMLSLTMTNVKPVNVQKRAISLKVTVAKMEPYVAEFLVLPVPAVAPGVEEPTTSTMVQLLNNAEMDSANTKKDLPVGSRHPERYSLHNGRLYHQGGRHASPFIAKKSNILAMARSCIAEIQDRMSDQYNKNRRQQIFTIGAEVPLSGEHLSARHLGITKKKLGAMGGTVPGDEENWPWAPPAQATAQP